MNTFFWRILFLFWKGIFCALFALILKYSERRSFCAHYLKKSAVHVALMKLRVPLTRGLHIRTTALNMLTIPPTRA